jgi:hypothetical protein
MDAFLVPDHIIASSGETSATPPRIDHICSMGRCARIVAALMQQQQRQQQRNQQQQQQQHCSTNGNGNGNGSTDAAAAAAEQPPPLFVVNFQVRTHDCHTRTIMHITAQALRGLRPLVPCSTCAMTRR